MTRKVLALLITFQCTFIIAAACVAVSKVPPDFSLQYTSGPVHADRDSHKFIRIYPSEKRTSEFRLISGVWHESFSMIDSRRKRDEQILNNITLTREELLPFYKVVVQSRFWRLRDKYFNRDILDGDYQRLTIQVGTKSKTVVLINSSPDRVKKIVAALNRLFSATIKKQN